ncbi:hypothetical protein ACFWU3_29675 [Streptomyces sp. NPDC058685]|uniref:hypothetical protein n=1 Tax=Streptomyces sp. NPDC058685 TaxID=3346598 RepID=UPI00366363A1
MSDDDRRKAQLVECEGCKAGPGRDNVRIVMVNKGRSITETWHLPDCPDHLVNRIYLEDSARRVQEEQAWAEGVFPSAHARLREAAAALTAGDPAAPIAAALCELVQAQAERAGCVTLAEWARILERHFPPHLPPLD